MDDITKNNHNDNKDIETYDKEESAAQKLEDIINQSASDEKRFYHDKEHYEDIGKGAGENLTSHLEEKGLSEDEIQQVNDRMVAAGMSHDIVQVQLASDPSDIIGNDNVREILEEYLDINDNEKTMSIAQEKLDNLDPDIANDRVVAMAVELFDIKADDDLGQFQGVNEFTTAIVHGVQRSESGVEDKEVLAEMGIIAGTIPFGDENDLYKLEERINNANDLLEEDSRLSPEEVKINNFAVAEIANRDVGNFQDEDYAVTNKGSVQMLQESGNDLDSFEGLNNAINGQVGFLEGHVVANENTRIFHAIDGYPEADKLNDMEEKAHENIETGSKFMASVQAAAAVIAEEHVNNGGSLEDSLRDMEKVDLSLPEKSNELSQQEEDIIRALNNHNEGIDPKIQDLAAEMVESLGIEEVMEIAKIAKEQENYSPEMNGVMEEYKADVIEESTDKNKMDSILSSEIIDKISDSGISKSSDDEMDSGTPLAEKLDNNKDKPRSI